MTKSIDFKTESNHTAINMIDGFLDEGYIVTAYIEKDLFLNGAKREYIIHAYLKEKGENNDK